jgi:hypothetical protein
LLALIKDAANVSKENIERAMTMAQRVSLELRAAEERKRSAISDEGWVKPVLLAPWPGGTARSCRAAARRGFNGCLVIVSGSDCPRELQRGQLHCAMRGR